jgi:hypothetical protein
MEIIPAVSNGATQINSAEFVKLTMYNDYNNVANTSTYTFSSAYQNVTIDGTVYLALGGLLSVGAQTRNLRVTEGDTSIALSGVSGNNISIVLGSEGKIRGSLVEVKRGFFDQNNVLANSYTRFKGIITNYNISEDREGKEDNYTVVVAASSYKTVLDNRIAGRKTNKESWRYFNSGDSSMDNVYSISGVQFDFGQDPKGKVVVPGGGGGRPGTGPGGDDGDMKEN